jgi:hypothetical protein
MSKDLKIQLQREMIAELTDQVLSLRAELAEREAPLSVTNFMVQAANVPVNERNTIRGIKEDAFVAGFMSAREHYGTDVDEDDPEDSGKTFHGAECARVQGPYVCTCDAEGERGMARDWAQDMYKDTVDKLGETR